MSGAGAFRMHRGKEPLAHLSPSFHLRHCLLTALFLKLPSRLSCSSKPYSSLFFWPLPQPAAHSRRSAGSCYIKLHDLVSSSALSLHTLSFASSRGDHQTPPILYRQKNPMCKTHQRPPARAAERCTNFRDALRTVLSRALDLARPGSPALPITLPSTVLSRGHQDAI